MDGSLEIQLWKVGNQSHNQKKTRQQSFFEFLFWDCNFDVTSLLDELDSDFWIYIVPHFRLWKKCIFLVKTLPEFRNAFGGWKIDVEPELWQYYERVSKVG